MRCKIARIQKLMWSNIMSSTKSQKTSVLHYSIDIDIDSFILPHVVHNTNTSSIHRYVLHKAVI